MKLHTLLLPALAVGGALYLTLPTPAGAFTTIGGSLSQSQRDLRVFDNFADATANNNTTPDANFPGYTGAELAIWKGAIEWSSELHGTGNGDPHQNGGLGSGGANFDPSWQGNAASAGGVNDNIVSAIPGDASGVLAFTQSPIADGWTIKFYDSAWNWDDGPGTAVSGMDLQGVLCHEYGHALGLGHSSTGGATMFPTISGSGVSQRSIAADDIAGVQSIYGVKSASKPRITGISLSGSSLTISGSNFSATNNEVWFTKTGTGGTGTPIKVTGVSSSGSSISVTVPATAGDGDVLVRNNGTANANLSNAWPIDVGSGPPPSCGVVSFGAGLPGNTGTLATLSSPTPGQPFTLNLSGLVITGAAPLILSLNTLNQPLLGFTVLVDYANPVTTTNVALSGGSGSFTFTTPNSPGTTYYFQAAAPQGGGSYIGTNRLDVTICP